MKIVRIELTNFRNHNKITLDFDGRSTLIIGPNGSGKTNILEAIHFLSTTKSLRTTFDKEIISHDTNLATIEGIIDHGDETQRLELTILGKDEQDNKSIKRTKINKVKKRLSDFAGTQNSVLFTPHDVEIFNRTPSVRRRYMNLLLFQVDNKYKRMYSEYVKAVRQRNRVLEKIRDFGSGADQIDFWNEKILTAGQYIQKERAGFFDEVNKKLENYSNMLNGEDDRYLANYKISEISSERIMEYKNAEIGAARTLIGPHKDDFEIVCNGHNIARFGSRGQKRTIVLALKLCEIDYIDNNKDRRPVLLLDDIFSELDESHKKAISKVIGRQQTIITSAEEVKIADDIQRIYL